MEDISHRICFFAQKLLNSINFKGFIPPNLFFCSEATFFRVKSSFELEPAFFPPNLFFLYKNCAITVQDGHIFYHSFYFKFHYSISTYAYFYILIKYNYTSDQ